MNYKDISQDTKTHYTLGTNERCVFFLFNRSDAITFSLAGEKSEAYIFCFFIGKKSEQHSLKIIQHHLAPQTTSQMLIKTLALDDSLCQYEGIISLDQNAKKSNASQESRALLLSSEARVSMKPTLEILTHDVVCSHKATASPLNPETLFVAQSRGLSLAQAKRLLISGFFNDALEQMCALGIDDTTRKKISTLLLQSFSH